MAKDNTVQDEGYGFIGNIKHYIMIDTMETEEDKERYREKLKKQDPTKYQQYIEWEKNLLKYGDG